MCGIIGYVGPRECKPLLLHGLKRLEYRGYDSAGIALLEADGLTHVRAVGTLDNLERAAGDSISPATTGLGHTRWATHGGVTERNAHPLATEDASSLAIVLNGIVENYRELRERLIAEGHTFASETDAETVTHLIEGAYEGDLVAAVRAAYAQLEGHFAFVAIHRDHPGRLVGARHQCPMVIGLREGETFVASNAAAFLRDTNVVQFPDDGEVVEITTSGARYFTAADGVPVEHEVVELDWDDEGAEKAGFETFMLKEIYEQPQAVADTIGDRVRHGRLELEGLGMDDDELRHLRRIVILSAGTSYHAAVAARYAIEEWARVPVEHDIASEWIYRNPVLDADTLVIGISQSGETRDTIEAVKLARAMGAHTVAITNMMGSQITREADSVLFTRAGTEVSVAASKTFTAQLSLLFLVALKLAQVRETLPASELTFILDEVYTLPDKIQHFLDGDHPIEEIARRYHDAPFFLYLGRHIGLPVALEGALKLKEISYIPTEAYSAGEMKHGPIALLDENTPVVVVATRIHVYDKIVSNIQEVRARGAHVIAVATDGNEDIQHHADDVIYVPEAPAFLQAVLAVVPLQLLAYRIARLRGLNVDQPRNLAKTVTVSDGLDARHPAWAWLQPGPRATACVPSGSGVRRGSGVETVADDGEAGFTTRAIHAGEETDPGTRAHATPIYQTATFAFETGERKEEVVDAAMAWEAGAYFYTRTQNPTTDALEQKVASLEGAETAVACASGMAAVSSTVFSLLSAGDHCVAADDVFIITRFLLDDVLARKGIEVTRVDVRDLDAARAALRPTTRAVFVETLSNPHLHLADVPALAEIAHGHDCPLVVDNTFLSPALLRPLEHGADLVLHSATKYLAGHGDTVCGVVAGRKELTDAIRYELDALGGAVSPFSSWLVARGMRTLPLRMDVHTRNASAVAELLAERGEVRWLSYPGHPSHPQHELAGRLLPRGSGGMVSLRLEGGADAMYAFVNALELAAIGVSLGDLKTLAYPMPKRDDLIRLSIGCEDVEDVLADVERGLAALG